MTIYTFSLIATFAVSLLVQVLTDCKSVNAAEQKKSFSNPCLRLIAPLMNFHRLYQTEKELNCSDLEEIRPAKERYFHESY